MTSTDAPQKGPDRVCYLHIGPHKTGTTTIQNALYVNAARLETIGLHYPFLSDPRRRNHSSLTRAGAMTGAGDLRTARYWSELSQKIAEVPGSIIISTEHFADVLRGPVRFQRVVDFFHGHGFRIVVVAYFRDQPGWLNSWYTQDQRRFLARQTFKEFLDESIEIGRVDPWGILQRFIDHERIEVRVVSFDQAIKKGLTRSFLDVIGVPSDFTMSEPPVMNPNLGVKGMYAAQEIMRRVDGPIRARPHYAALYKNFKDMMKGRGWDKTAYVGVSPEDEARIRDHYRTSNEAFAQQFFGASWETVCPPRASSHREFDFEAASAEDQRDVLDVVENMVSLIEAVPAAPVKKSRALHGENGEPKRKLTALERASRKLQRMKKAQKKKAQKKQD